MYPQSGRAEDSWETGSKVLWWRCHGTDSDTHENDKSNSLNTESLQTGTEIFLLVTKPRLLETATFSNREHFKLLIELSNNSSLC